LGLVFDSRDKIALTCGDDVVGGGFFGLCKIETKRAAGRLLAWKNTTLGLFADGLFDPNGAGWTTSVRISPGAFPATDGREDSDDAGA